MTVGPVKPEPTRPAGEQRAADPIALLDAAIQEELQQGAILQQQGQLSPLKHRVAAATRPQAGRKEAAIPQAPHIVAMLSRGIEQANVNARHGATDSIQAAQMLLDQLGPIVQATQDEVKQLNQLTAEGRTALNAQGMALYQTAAKLDQPMLEKARRQLAPLPPQPERA